MKIKCEFCGAMYDDSNEHCPSCGADNPGAIRSGEHYSGPPRTIEELKQWYEDRNLPPYETTRFFIGQNYKKPKAFGIYKDEETGLFVVYKNKDTGDRSIRYTGTDEAYAVNELYMKLKEEIVRQKQRNEAKRNTNTAQEEKLTGSAKIRNFFDENLAKIILSIVFFVAGGSVLFIILGALGFNVFQHREKTIKTGYYAYNEKVYYYDNANYDNQQLHYFEYDSTNDTWKPPVTSGAVEEPLQKVKTAKKYYIGNVWDSSMPCSNFFDSIIYKDILVGFNIDTGYYKVGEDEYYHLKPHYNEGWYYYTSYDGEWIPYFFIQVPEELRHPSTSIKSFRGVVKPSTFKASNFEQTIFYKDYIAGPIVDTGYYLCEDTYYYHLYDNSNDGWYYYENDYSWEPVEDDKLPYDLQHSGLAKDVYYCPTWDSSITDFGNFEDTYYYAEYQEEIERQNAENSGYSSDSGYDSGYDSDFDWDSGDSWDSDYSDWGSDW